MKAASIKFVANLEHVREVSLLGTADLGFWKDQLRSAELIPVESGGKAQLTIIAADARFLGLRFRELSFSVLVSGEENGYREGAYLVQAFNSRRLFAFCERTFFSTPYDPGDVQVSAAYPASLQLTLGREVVLRAAMHCGSPETERPPAFEGQSGWEGPVFLPVNRAKKGDRGRLFHARILGHTRRYLFEPRQDAVQIRPSPGSRILQGLIDSSFTGKEWSVREDAAHAKSRTCRRSGPRAGVVQA